MFGNNLKEDKPFTPADLTKLSGNNDVLDRISSRKSTSKLSSTKKWQRIAFWSLISIVSALLITFFVSLFLTHWGDLVISVDKSLSDKGIIIGNSFDKNGNILNPQVTLNAPSLQEVTNITQSWLPDNLDKTNGSHNGKNYLAYTFYLDNNGTQNVTYQGALKITGVSKHMDEAIRVMVYKNGKPVVYAKRQMGKNTAEPETTKFADDSTVMNTVTENLKPKSHDKFTIVSWVEGTDPECVNDIMGGYIRMSMLFSIAGEKE
ncbi:MAG: hypothetical protein Q8876_07825 [Bacillota bacterium]|nr:hypothetical protein [Bacillota bacterium]